MKRGGAGGSDDFSRGCMFLGEDVEDGSRGLRVEFDGDLFTATVVHATDNTEWIDLHFVDDQFEADLFRSVVHARRIVGAKSGCQVGMLSHVKQAPDHELERVDIGRISDDFVCDGGHNRSSLLD